MNLPVVGLTVTLLDGTQLPANGLSVTVPDPPPAGGVVPVFGAWTPVIGGFGGEAGQAYHFQTGHYIRIGPLVLVWAYTQFSAKGTINGALALKGLPFPTRGVAGFFAGTCSYSSNLSPNVAAGSNILCHASGGQSQVTLFAFVPGTNPKQLDSNDINDATQFVFALAYPIDGV